MDSAAAAAAAALTSRRRRHLERQLLHLQKHVQKAVVAARREALLEAEQLDERRLHREDLLIVCFCFVLVLVLVCFQFVGGGGR